MAFRGPFCGTVTRQKPHAQTGDPPLSPVHTHGAEPSTALAPSTKETHADLDVPGGLAGGTRTEAGATAPNTGTWGLRCQEPGPCSLCRRPRGQGTREFYAPGRAGAGTSHGGRAWRSSLQVPARPEGPVVASNAGPSVAGLCSRGPAPGRTRSANTRRFFCDFFVLFSSPAIVSVGVFACGPGQPQVGDPWTSGRFPRWGSRKSARPAGSVSDSGAVLRDVSRGDRPRGSVLS